MPISVECPDCGERNRFPDHLEGKNGRCKSCRSRIAIRRRKKSGKKKQAASGGLMIVGIAIGVLLLAGGGIFFFLNSGGEDDALNLAEVAPVEQGENASNEAAPADIQSPNLTDASPATPDSTSTPPTGMVATGGQPASSATPATSFQQPKSSSSAASGFQNPANSALGLTFSRSEEWQVQPDPGTAPLEIEVGKPLRIKLDKNSLRGSGLVFPVAPSPFVATRSGTFSNEVFEIFNVATGQKVSEAPSPGSSAVMALSEDGTYLAAALSGAKQIAVFDLRAGKSLGTLTTSETGMFQTTTLAVWKDRLVALSNIHKGIKVWELPSGKLLQEITTDDKFNPDYGHSFSPGGRYLAVDGQFLEKRIDFYDLESGKLVGSISPAGKIRVSELEAMGFSSDGTRFAAIYGIDIFTPPARKYSRMVVWDVATGTSSADFEMEPRLKEQLDPVYKSHTLESLPDGNRWLVHSLGIIDASVEKLIYSFPKQENVDLVPSRKVISSGAVLSAITSTGSPRLEETKFTEEELLAGIAAASAGGFASDAGMPPLSPSDASRAADALVSNSWTAQPDPLRSSAIQESINVSTAGTVRGIVVARGPQPFIGVQAGIDEDLNDPKIANYEQTRQIFESRGLELEVPIPIAKETELLVFAADGTAVAKQRIPFSAQLHAISPDGKWAAVEQHRTNGRLDVYAVENEGKHLIGWRPFGSASDKNHREIRKVDFIDSEHLATLSKNYQLVVWKLPSLEAVWKMDEASDFAVSPGGKTVAVVQGNILGSKSLAIFASRTGEGLGATDLTGQSKAIAFHPNGELLAISLDSEANKTLRILEVESGQTAEEFPLPLAAASVCWTGPDNLLLNGRQLVNRPMQSVVWSYNADDALFPPTQVAEQLTALQRASRKVLIRTVDIPHAGMAAKLNRDQLASQAVLKPGDTVKLDVQVGTEPLLSPFRASAAQTLTAQLQASQTQVNPNAGIICKASISTTTEGTTTLSKIGDRSVSETVNRKLITIEIEYTRQGSTIWQSRRRVSNLDQILVRLKPGQPAQEAIDEQMLKSAESILSRMKLPMYIFGENAGKGLGTSTLWE